MLPASVGWVVLLMGGMLVLGWMRRIVGFWGNTLVLFLCLPGMVMMQMFLFVLLLCCSGAFLGFRVAR